MEEDLSIFLVDDSPTSRLALRQALTSQAGVRILGEAVNGKEALEKIPGANPDVVLMDVAMPVMDGITATKMLTAQDGRRHIMLISDLAERDRHLGFRGLEAGALDVMQKPTGRELRDLEFCRRWVKKLRLLSKVPLVSRRSPRAGPAAPANRLAPPAVSRRYRYLCVGASTGGPQSLQRLLSSLGGKPPWPILIVQHISEGFVKGLSSWLTDTTGVIVRLAATGEAPEPGVAYLPPDGVHLTLRQHELTLVGPAAGARADHVPSVDVLFDSVVDSGAGVATLAVLLTGMGADGARGLLRVREAGGWTIAQDEATSVVYGMPKAAHKLGAACEVLPLDAIGPRALGLTRPS
ncbi:MAG: response regulator [Armatimonadetes bacterium]|nr:response regulator [Armatimonadota bacterium]